MPKKSEKEAWLHIIEPDDLDKHMTNIKQANTNAEIVKDLFKKHPLKEGSKLLIHGCGTCQIFDYIKPSDIGNVHMTFADISPKLLEVTKRRLSRHKIAYDVLIDDIENTNIKKHYDAVLLVLVLLHVDWKRSLENMIKLNPSSFYIIEQEQKTEGCTVTKEKKLPPSIRKYAEVSTAELIHRKVLIKFFNDRGYKLVYTTKRAVPDEKVMVGFVFKK